jgi:hypothetical protein
MLSKPQQSSGGHIRHVKRHQPRIYRARHAGPGLHDQLRWTRMKGRTKAECRMRGAEWWEGER